MDRQDSEVPYDSDESDLLLSALDAAIGASLPKSQAAQFAEYDLDIPRFSTEILGNRQWEFQKYLQRALVQHRFVMVCGPRKNSKTHSAAEIVVGFMATAPTVCLTTSGSERQVEFGLWQKIRGFHAKAKYPLPGKPRKAAWEVAPEWYAMGFSAADAGTVQGFHAGVTLSRDAEDPKKPMGVEEAIERIHKHRESPSRLLLVLDEASEIKGPILERLEGSMSGSNVYVLAQTNPTFDPEGDHPAARWWRRGSRFHRIHVCGEEIPDPAWEIEPADKCFHSIPEEIQEPSWRAEQIKSHGIDSLYTRVFVFGLPAIGQLENALVPRRMLEACAELEPVGDDRHIGVDIGAGGKDPSVAYLWIGNTLAARHQWSTADTMATVGTIIELMRAWGEEAGKPVPAKCVHIDATGVGKGVADRLKQTGHAVDAVDFGAGARYARKGLTGQTMFRNMRAEMHWTLRRLLEEQAVCVPKRFGEVWKQAGWYSYHFHEAAKGSLMELKPSKDELREKYGRSPDDLDAAILGLTRKPEAIPRMQFRKI